MTTIKLSCSHCECDQERRPAELQLYESGSEQWLIFDCLICGENDRRQMSDRRVALLLAAGVELVDSVSVLARLLEDETAIDRELLS